MKALSTPGTFYSRWDRELNFVVLCLSILYLYHVRYTLRMLDPVLDGWLMKHDWATHYLAWFFYRNEPWTFPIGTISNYLYPVGTNVGFTDSIPLAAIFFKIFSPILPSTFQYLGPWMFMCHVLTAYFSLRLLEALGVRGLSALAATLIISWNPVLLHRSIHPALCSHWVILGSMWVYVLDPSRYSSRRLIIYQSILLIVGCLINPYFSVFEAGLYGALVWKLWRYDRTIGFVKAVSFSAIAFGLLFVLWYVIGFFSFKSKGDLGVSGAYGLYSFNLNSLFNSQGWSMWIHYRPTVSWHQYESFMFLGVGVMGLMLITALLAAYKRLKPGSSSNEIQEPGRHWTPLVIVTILISLFAITHVVTFDDKVLFTLSVPDKFLKFGNIFRASARYFWLAYYGLIILTIVSFVRFAKNTLISFTVLMICFVVQVYDGQHLIYSAADKSDMAYAPYHPPLKAPSWNDLFAKLDRFIFYPPFESTYITDTDYRYFCYLAALNKKPINLGYAARLDNRAMTDYSDSLRRSLDVGTLQKQTLYITTPEYVGRFLIPFDAGQLGVVNLDGYYVFFPSELKEEQPFSSLTAEVPPVLSERLRFSALAGSPVAEADRSGMYINRMERSARNIFVQGWLRQPPGMQADVLLKTADGSTFVSLSSALMNDRYRTGATDSLFFGGTFFTDNLKAGPYELGVMIHEKNSASSSQAAWFGTINVGSPEDYSAVEKQPEDRMNGWIDDLEYSGSRVKIMGWAVMEGQSSFETITEIVLRSGDKLYYVPTDPVLREDVAGSFNSPQRIEMCGFVTSITKKSLPPGDYEIGILVRHRTKPLRAIEFMQRYFTIGDNSK